MRHCRYHVASALRFTAAAACYAYLALTAFFSAPDYGTFLGEAFWLGVSLGGMSLLDIIADVRGVTANAMRAAEHCVLDQGERQPPEQGSAAAAGDLLALTWRAGFWWCLSGEIEGYLDKVRKGKHDDRGIQGWQKTLRRPPKSLQPPPLPRSLSLSHPPSPRSFLFDCSSPWSLLGHLYGIPVLGDALWELNPLPIDFNPVDPFALQHERLRVFFNVIGVGVAQEPMDQSKVEGLLGWLMERAHEATADDSLMEEDAAEGETMLANRRLRDQIDDRRAGRLAGSLCWQIGLGESNTTESVFYSSAEWLFGMTWSDPKEALTPARHSLYLSCLVWLGQGGMKQRQIE